MFRENPLFNQWPKMCRFNLVCCHLLSLTIHRTARLELRNDDQRFNTQFRMCLFENMLSTLNQHTRCFVYATFMPSPFHLAEHI